MRDPDRPQVRVYDGAVYIERAPGAWVYVTDKIIYDKVSTQEQERLIARGLRVERDGPLPVADLT